jgi:hypothetical protein
MRTTVFAMALALGACGGGASNLLPEAERQARCNEFLTQFGGEMGCRSAELAAGQHTGLDTEQRFHVTVSFRTSGSVERFWGLQREGHIDEVTAEVPECVVGRIKQLRVPPRADGVVVPFQIRYQSELPTGPYAAVLADGTCSLTLAAP